MKVQVEQLSNIERKLSIEVPWDTVKEELDLAYKGLSRRARVKGFRAGKVPRKVLEQLYRGTVENEVVSRLVDESFRKAVQDNDLVPIDNPKMDAFPKLENDTPLVFEATVEVKPEINIERYEGLDVVRKIRAVEDSEVDTELEQLRQKAMVIEAITDRSTAENGDMAVVDFFGTVDGEDFKGGKGINYTIELGGGQMIPGFEDQLVGMNIGDQKVFELAFPKGEAPEEVGDKTVDWKVDLKELKRKILPELDDDFAQDLGEYDTLDELKENLRENLATREDARSRRQLRDQVMEKLVEANPVEVPPLMIERQLDFMLQEANRMAQQSSDPSVQEVIVKLREEARPQAEKQVAGMLLLESVARKAEIEASDEDIEGRIAELAREHRMPAKQVRKQLVENDQIDALRYNLTQDMALDYVLEKANVTEQQVTAEELEAADKDETEGD
ncbi:MAG: trigger factor [Myxococcota bacterium]